MKTYTKTHSSKKVADVHLAKIKQRGGKATVTTVKGGTKIDYYFPEKVTTKKTPSNKTVAKKSGISQKEYKSLHPGTKNELKKSIKATKPKKYDVISPDGFSIRIGVPPFKSEEERKKYFEMWKKRYEAQGYYSSNEGRIPLSELADRCEWITL